jgi:hypothetical protein
VAGVADGRVDLTVIPELALIFRRLAEQPRPRLRRFLCNETKGGFQDALPQMQ